MIYTTFDLMQLIAFNVGSDRHGSSTNKSLAMKNIICPMVEGNDFFPVVAQCSVHFRSLYGSSF